MNNSLNLIECLIGSKIKGSCNQFRSKIKKPKIVFNDFNCFYYVLEKMAVCKIKEEIKKEGHLEYIRFLREIGFDKIKNIVNQNIKGDEITCESENKLNEEKANNLNLEFKGRIVFSILCRQCSKSHEFNLNQVFNGTLPQYKRSD